MSGGLVRVDDPAAVAEIERDPVGVMLVNLARAKSLLAECLRAGDLDAIKEVKARADAMAAYVRQREYAQEAQLHATEIVRRAERGIGLGIRQGQEAGTIASHGSNFAANPGSRHSQQRSPSEFANRVELYGNGEVAGVLEVAELGSSDEKFEAAITEAKTEKNLSRANVVRKLGGKDTRKKSRSEYQRGKKRIRGADVMERLIVELETVEHALDLVDVDEFDEGQRNKWADGMTDALRPIRGFIRALRVSNQKG